MCNAYKSVKVIRWKAIQEDMISNIICRRAIKKPHGYAVLKYSNRILSIALKEHRSRYSLIVIYNNKCFIEHAHAETWFIHKIHQPSNYPSICSVYYSDNNMRQQPQIPKIHTFNHAIFGLHTFSEQASIASSWVFHTLFCGKTILSQPNPAHNASLTTCNAFKVDCFMADMHSLVINCVADGRPTDMSLPLTTDFLDEGKGDHLHMELTLSTTCKRFLETRGLEWSDVLHATSAAINANQGCKRSLALEAAGWADTLSTGSVLWPAIFRIEHVKETSLSSDILLMATGRAKERRWSMTLGGNLKCRGHCWTRTNQASVISMMSWEVVHAAHASVALHSVARRATGGAFLVWESKAACSQAHAVTWPVNGVAFSLWRMMLTSILCNGSWTIDSDDVSLERSVDEDETGLIWPASQWEEWGDEGGDEHLDDEKRKLEIPDGVSAPNRSDFTGDDGKLSTRDLRGELCDNSEDENIVAAPPVAAAVPTVWTIPPAVDPAAIGAK